jgi:hypothetical protein
MPLACITLEAPAAIAAVHMIVAVVVAPDVVTVPIPSVTVQVCPAGWVPTVIE